MQRTPGVQSKTLFITQLLVLACIFLGADCFYANPVWAWNFPEHKELGEKAYQKACDCIDKRTDKTTWEIDNDTKINSTKFKIACDASSKIGSHYYYELIFGQACALAGDYLSSPGEFSSKFVGQKTDSFREYIALASVNSDHFHPHSFDFWQKYHGEAMEKATFSDSEYGIIKKTFENALYNEAFAGHYLHDAFSSGHMGFNREASGLNASRLFHDQWDNLGRIVADRSSPAPHVWFTLGDGYLTNCRGRECEKRILDAATNSMVSFLYTFITSSNKRNNDLERKITESFPAVIYHMNHDRNIDLRYEVSPSEDFWTKTPTRAWIAKNIYPMQVENNSSLLAKIDEYIASDSISGKRFKLCSKCEEWEDTEQIRLPAREMLSFEYLGLTNSLYNRRIGEPGKVSPMGRLVIKGLPFTDSFDGAVADFFNSVFNGFQPYINLFNRDGLQIRNYGALIPITTSFDGLVVHSLTGGYLKTKDINSKIGNEVEYLGYRATIEGLSMPNTISEIIKYIPLVNQIPSWLYPSKYNVYKIYLFLEAAPATESFFKDYKNTGFYGSIGIGITYNVRGGEINKKGND